MVEIHGYLNKNTDNAVEFDEATDIIGGQYVNTATMSVSVYTQSGVLVAGPIEGTYITDSAGHYFAIVQDSIDWTLDSIYQLKVVIDGGANRKLTMVRNMELIE